MRDFAFYLGLGALFTHELDAVSNREWRVLPIMQSLSDELGMTVFVAMHVPMFAVIIALVASTKEKTRTVSRAAVAIFLVFHGALHFLFRTHPNYEFSSTMSEMLIYGGAALGAIYLGLEGRRGYSQPV